MFKLQAPSKCSPCDAIHLSRCFFHGSKQVLNSSIWMPFWASAIFCFTSSTLAKCFLLRTFSSQETKKVTRGETGWTGRVEGGGHAIFGQKLLNTQQGVGRCACKSPIMKWANASSLQKNSLKLNAASHNNARWATDTDGFLVHSRSGGSLDYKVPALQKIILFIGGVFPHMLPFFLY